VDNLEKKALYFTGPQTYTYLWDISGTSPGTHTLIAKLFGAPTPEAGHPYLGIYSNAYEIKIEKDPATNENKITEIKESPAEKVAESPAEFKPLKITDFTKRRLLNLVQGTPFEGNWVVGLLIALINWLLEIAGALAVIAIVYSGLMYITSAGVPEKAEKAKKNLIWAIIGLVIIALAILIVSWLKTAIGLS